MRKSELIEQNELMFKQIEELRREVTALKEELKTKTAELKSAKKSNMQNIRSKSPLKQIEEKITVEQSSEENADAYGAKAIGKIVVAAASVTSVFCDLGGNAARERINLVLGRAEVAKSEILGVVSSDAPYKEKKIKIDNITEKALEYFENVRAQKI